MLEQSRIIYAFDSFQLDARKRLLLQNGQPVQITSKAFDLLLAMVESGGRELSKDELMERVWSNQIVEDANLTVTMSHLRKALGEKAGEHRFIVTIPGRGYRFIGELRAPEGFIIEQHTVSEIVVEDETEREYQAIAALPTGAAAISRSASVPNEFSSPVATGKNKTAGPSRRPYGFGVAGLLFLTILGFGIFKFFGRQTAAPPFQKIRLTRLTNSGTITGAAISPDGRFVAYVLGESEGNSLWVQQVGTASKVRILSPTRAHFWDVSFSPDGAHIYYNLFSADKADPELFRIPSLGGVVERIPNVIATGGITFAPDGKRFAYHQPDSAASCNYLVVSDADGGNNRVIAKKNHPNTFEPQEHTVSWSPDGVKIACVVNNFEAEASYSSIVVINVKDGTERLLSPQRWHDVLSVSWLRDGSGLLIAASDKASANSQVWFLSYPEGETRQITNDLNQHSWLKTSASGASFVTLETSTVNSIFIGESGAAADDFKEVASEVGPLNPFVWTPEGNIIFRSARAGVSNLWIMEADGSNQKQLTANAQVDSRGLSISPDGKQLVFASSRSGKTNLWRVDADGRNLVQLTDGEADAHPRCTPDGRSVVFQRGLSSHPSLWKVPLAGGTPVQLTEFRAKWPAVSGDGSRISYLHMANGKWRIGIVSADGGPMLQSADVPAALAENVLQWSPDDQRLLYISEVGSVGNIWSLPLDGALPAPVTHFKSHSLSYFSWSPDRKRLALARRTQMSDVVLIENLASR